MGGDVEIAKEFIKKMKDHKRVLPTKYIHGTEGFTTVIDER